MLEFESDAGQYLDSLAAVALAQAVDEQAGHCVEYGRDHCPFLL